MKEFRRPRNSAPCDLRAFWSVVDAAEEASAVRETNGLVADRGRAYTSLERELRANLADMALYPGHVATLRRRILGERN
jgi:hypothetical protein